MAERRLRMNRTILNDLETVRSILSEVLWSEDGSPRQGLNPAQARNTRRYVLERLDGALDSIKART
jgi:hypothetical protein